MVNARPIIPGQINVQASVMRLSNAAPGTFVIQTPDGPRCVVFGGLSKLEELAGRIGAAIVSGLFGVDPKGSVDPEEVGRISVEIADKILRASFATEESARNASSDTGTHSSPIAAP